MGRPIEPGLRWSRRLNVATGDVSDRPYPSRITVPNAFSNPCSTSTGSAAPPETHSRSVDVSGAPAASWSIPTYMVGTPSNTVTLSRSITRSACAALNREISVRQAPDSTAAFSPQVWPKQWNSGRHPITTSSGPSPSSVVAVTEALRRRLACVSSAPLGVPVVPEVYRITAVSSSPRLCHVR